MTTRHVNANMIRFVEEGIRLGGVQMTDNQKEHLLASSLETATRLYGELTPPGDRPFVVAGFLKAKELARVQGLIAAL